MSLSAGWGATVLGLGAGALGDCRSAAGGVEGDLCGVVVGGKARTGGVAAGKEPAGGAAGLAVVDGTLKAGAGLDPGTAAGVWLLDGAAGGGDVARAWGAMRFAGGAWG